MFRRTLQFSLDWEGGFVNHPEDDGGATNHGISLDFAQQIGIASSVAEIKALTVNDVEPIYHDYFWLEAGCNDMPWHIAPIVFDFSITSGVETAVKELQLLLNTKPDGLFGPKTKAALEDETNTMALAVEYTTSRILYYESLTDFRHFGEGWTHRAVDTLRFAVTSV